MDTVTLELTVRFIVDRDYLSALYSIAVSENPLPVSGRIAPERGPAHES